MFVMSQNMQKILLGNLFNVKQQQISWKTKMGELLKIQIKI